MVLMKTPLILGSYFTFNNYFSQNNSKKNVLLYGYGYAGQSFCKHLDKNKFNVTLICPSLLEFKYTCRQSKFINLSNLLI